MSGQIELPSGTWTWHRFDVIERPSGRLDRVTIRLDLEGATGSVMRIEFEPFDGEVDPAVIALKAHHPRHREVTVDGKSWKFITIERPDLALGVGNVPIPEPYRVSFLRYGCVRVGSPAKQRRPRGGDRR